MNLDLDIEFVDENHDYYLNGKKLKNKSATSFISYFFPKFDTDKISKNCCNNENSKYFGRDPEKVKKEWQLKGKKAINHGNAVHNQIDAYFSGKLSKDEITEEKAIFGIEYAQRLQGKITTELVLCSKIHRIPGTIDLIVEHGNNAVSIWDWKTNEKIIKPEFSKNKNSIVGHLPNVKLTQYFLQLSLYAYILEQEFGYSIRDLKIIHLNEKFANPIQAPFLRDEIKDMLEYKKNNPEAFLS